MSAGTARPLPQLSNLELLATAISPGSGTIPQYEFQQAFFAPGGDGVLDPVAVAAQQADPRYLAASRAVAAIAAERRSRQLDRGAAAADLLASRVLAGTRVNELLSAVLGPGGVIRPNLSGFRKEPRLFYPIAPGVQYETQLAPARVGGGLGGRIEFVRFEDTPMMDWDIPSGYHAASNVTVRHLGDVEELARAHVERHPNSRLRLYQTPGGFRAWELGRRQSPQEYLPEAEAMKVDGDYIRIAQQPNVWEVEGLTVGRPGFSSRISGKPGRANDWVAQPLLTISGREAMPDPVNVARVRQFHDEPIRRAYLGEQGISPHAMEALQRQASTASAALRNELMRRRLLS